MIIDGMSVDELLERAVGLPIQYLETKEVVYECSCDRERMLGAVAALGKEDIDDLVEKKENVELQCEFRKEKYV
ncbi:MAG: Hsp33 family molecular chaperone HslO [Desulfobacterales bacterium]|nr:Hsp33 family molecular chaperone HslO [Desulfobacterales bacterium]